jgi:hypothetical protein
MAKIDYQNNPDAPPPEYPAGDIDKAMERASGWGNAGDG